MKILVTGAAGFIGYHVTKSLINANHKVVALDNINDYYEVQLKFARLKELGFEKEQVEPFHLETTSKLNENLTFTRANLEDRDFLFELFSRNHFDKVCNLAAQAGVRYSLEKPEKYIESNIVGFLNILECCRHYKINHLVYASSSSVYGQNKKVPFSTTDNVDHPISLYAASKKSNELMAYTYSHLFGIKTTGLRFFTVYGPWGRPDMAIFLFTKAILENVPINVYNNGKLKRDFTYIEDIVDGVHKIINDQEQAAREDKYKIYNLGNNQPVELLDFIKTIETSLGQKAQKLMLPMQPGDVPTTWADIDETIKDIGYRPKTPITNGIPKFVAWYKTYYGLP